MEYPVQLQANETVTAVIKRHPVHLWARELVVIVIVLLVLFLWNMFGRSSVDVVSTVWNIIAIVTVLAGLVVGFVYWYRYNNDLWLITSERLIDSTRATPFNHNVQTASLLNIQDINIRQRGMAQSMFKYGDVTCQTASASGNNFHFRGVADPQSILDQIERARSQARRQGRSDDDSTALAS